MDNFISIIRTDRKREINKYKNMKYSVGDEKNYRLIDGIKTLQNGYIFEFGAEATEREIYFYVIEDGANAYFSIVEIYELLQDIMIREGEDFVIDLLKEQIQIEIEVVKNSENDNKEKTLNQERFLYRGVEYYIKRTVEINDKRNGQVKPWDSSVKISYRQFFTLLNLIQEKSNALFSRGKNNDQYKNGLIRLLIVLLINNHDIPILLQKGWKYDDENEKYTYQKIEEETEISKRKYYLTEEEYKNIIE